MKNITVEPMATPQKKIENIDKTTAPSLLLFPQNGNIKNIAKGNINAETIKMQVDIKLSIIITP